MPDSGDVQSFLFDQMVSFRNSNINSTTDDIVTYCKSLVNNRVRVSEMSDRFYQNNISDLLFLLSARSRSL